LEADFGEVTVIFDDEMTATGAAHQLTLNATPRIHTVPPQARQLDDLRAEVGFLATLVGFCRGLAAELDQLWLVTEDGIRVCQRSSLASLPTRSAESSRTRVSTSTSAALSSMRYRLAQSRRRAMRLCRRQALAPVCEERANPGRGWFSIYRFCGPTRPFFDNQCGVGSFHKIDRRDAPSDAAPAT
jgi:hypothetical protein